MLSVADALKAAEQDDLNAFTQLRPEALDEPARSGPLAGVPVAIKDLFDVAGMTTTGCCAAYAEREPSRTDSAVVELLRDAGAVVIGKTNQHELACGTSNLVSSAGPVLNPWDRSRIPGGSSGGSAVAVAAGIVPLAIGSDTGGSIRIPSSFCGVTGLKPTHGAIPMRGAMPMTPSCDTAGPIARTAAECAAAFRVLCTFDPDDPWSQDGRPADPPESVERMRIAVPQSFLREADVQVAEAVEAAARVFEELGCVIDEIEGPSLEGNREMFAPLIFAEVAHHYRDLWGDGRVLEPTRHRIDFGRAVTAADYVKSVAAGRLLRRDFEWSLTAADAMLCPCTTTVAPPVDRPTGVGPADDKGGPASLTLPVNVAGVPALAFPIGFSEDGLPVGAQLIGRPWTEEVLCALGAAYQGVTDWHARSPV